MNLDLSNWKEFCIGDLFDIHPTKTIDGVTSDDCVYGGRTPLVVNQSFNNGIAGNCNYGATENGGIITFSDTWEGETFFYQEKNFIGFAHVQGMYPKRKMSGHCLLFITMMLEYEARNRYSYGRKKRRDIISKSFIKLPVDADGNPDWQFMEDYIKSLHHKPLTTKNRLGQALELNVSKWKYFLLKDICVVSMGNKMDAIAMTSDNPEYNFVGRSEGNNGVAMKVDAVYDDNNTLINPYPAGCITVALGGSLGSTYLQKEPFYTSQNVSVLQFPENVSDGAKLFICALIHNESRYKYFPFGRELNTHIRKDFGFTLPVDSDGNPNWQFMEDYIKSLPYGDRLEG